MRLRTLFASQKNISIMEKGKVIVELSLQRQRSISPLGHRSHMARNVWGRTSTSTSGASLQKQCPEIDTNPSTWQQDALNYHTRAATKLGDEEPHGVLVVVEGALGVVSRRQRALALDDAGGAEPPVLGGHQIEESDRIDLSRQVLRSH